MEGDARRLSGGKVQNFPHRSGNFAILLLRQFNSFAFVALLARVKPRISTVRAAIRWMRPFWAHLLFVISYRAFAGLTRNPSGDAPSLTLAGVKSIGG